MDINKLLNTVKSDYPLTKEIILLFIDEVLKKISFTKNSYIYKFYRIDYIRSFLKMNKSSNLFIDRELLLEIILWYYVVTNQNTPEWLLIKFKNFYNRNKLHYYRINDLKEIGYKTIDIVTDAVLLSATEINDYNIEQDDINKWLKIRKANSDLFIGMYLAGMLIGHLGAVVLSENEYFEMRHGKLMENEIISSNYFSNNINYLYFPTIVIKKKFRKPLLTRDLILNFLQLVFQLDKLKTLKSIIVNVYSDEGRYLCTKLGFKFLTNHKDGGEVYELDLINISNKLQYIKRKLNHT